METNQNRRRRKSGSAAMYIPIAVLIILFLTIFGTSVFLRVAVIEVSGALSYTEEEIIAASRIEIGDNMVLIDRIAAGRRVREALQYVSAVRVTVTFPGTVNIEVQESAAVAWVRFHNGFLVIDSAGRIIRQEGILPSGLIEIRGIDPVLSEVGTQLESETATQAQLNAMAATLMAIENARIADGVSYLDVSSVANIYFEYLDLYTVILGTTDNIERKLELLPIALERRPTADGPGRIDLSSLPRVTWRPDR